MPKFMYNLVLLFPNSQRSTYGDTGAVCSIGAQPQKKKTRKCNAPAQVPWPKHQPRQSLLPFVSVDSLEHLQEPTFLSYHCQPTALLATCNGCGATFSLQHGLDCPKSLTNGTLRSARTAPRLAQEACGRARVEIVKHVVVLENDKEERPSLQANWGAEGVYEGNRVAFLFDNHLFVDDAHSYSFSNILYASAVLGNTAAHVASEKRRK